MIAFAAIIAAIADITPRVASIMEKIMDVGIDKNSFVMFHT